MLVVVVLVPVQAAGSVENDVQIRQKRLIAGLLYLGELVDECEMLPDDVQCHVGMSAEETCVGYQANGRTIQ